MSTSAPSLLRARRGGHLQQGRRAAPSDSPPALRAHRPRPARRISSSTATASASASPTTDRPAGRRGRIKRGADGGADVVLLPKPHADDLADARRPGPVGLAALRPGPRLTQLAIDKELTLIAFEAMNHWATDGGFGLHVFHKNNELAGYCSVLHALALTGSTGDYGRRLSAVVIGFGATARGAVTALNAHGIHDVQVLTNRGVAAVGADPLRQHHAVRSRRRSPLPEPGHHRAGPGSAGAVPGRERHRGQLHAAGSEQSAHLPADRGPGGRSARAA